MDGATMLSQYIRDATNCYLLLAHVNNVHTFTLFLLYLHSDSISSALPSSENIETENQWKSRIELICVKAAI